MSNTTNKAPQAAALAGVQALIAGTQKHFPNGQFTLGNTAYTTASLVQVLPPLVDAYAAVSAARLNARDAVAALRTTEAKVEPVIRDYVTFLRATFSNATAQLGDFGLQAPKARTPLPPEQRLAATVKARATRIARGTVGKKKKLTVKGEVIGVTVTPITTSGPTPSSGTAPAPAPAAPASAPAASPPAAPAGATAPASTTTAPAVVARLGNGPRGVSGTSTRALSRGGPGTSRFFLDRGVHRPAAVVKSAIDLDEVGEHGELEFAPDR
jgi:hypothetical protein